MLVNIKHCVGIDFVLRKLDTTPITHETSVVISIIKIILDTRLKI
jgi:hypothetical protein